MYSQRCSHLWLLPPKNVRAEILFKIRLWTREESRGTAFALGDVCEAIYHLFLCYVELKPLFYLLIQEPAYVWPVDGNIAEI